MNRINDWKSSPLVPLSEYWYFGEGGWYSSWEDCWSTWNFCHSSLHWLWERIFSRICQRWFSSRLILFNLNNFYIVLIYSIHCPEKMFADEIPKCTDEECGGHIKPGARFISHLWASVFSSLMYYLMAYMLQILYFSVRGCQINSSSLSRRWVIILSMPRLPFYSVKYISNYTIIYCCDLISSHLIFISAFEDLPKCDLLIILGTSLVVQPFASLVDRWILIGSLISLMLYLSSVFDSSFCLSECLIPLHACTSTLKKERARWRLCTSLYDSASLETKLIIVKTNQQIWVNLLRYMYLWWGKQTRIKFSYISSS